MCCFDRVQRRIQGDFENASLVPEAIADKIDDSKAKKMAELSALEVEFRDLDNVVSSVRDELRKSEERCNALEKLKQGLALIREGLKDVKASCQDIFRQKSTDDNTKKEKAQESKQDSREGNIHSSSSEHRIMRNQGNSTETGPSTLTSRTEPRLQVPLGIDPEVFLALPPSIQRELFVAHEMPTDDQRLLDGRGRHVSRPPTGWPGPDPR